MSSKAATRLGLRQFPKSHPIRTSEDISKLTKQTIKTNIYLSLFFCYLLIKVWNVVNLLILRRNKNFHWTNFKTRWWIHRKFESHGLGPLLGLHFLHHEFYSVGKLTHNWTSRLMNVSCQTSTVDLYPFSTKYIIWHPAVSKSAFVILLSFWWGKC